MEAGRKRQEMRSLDFVQAHLEPGRYGMAVFAGGCFWGVEYFLQKAPGVLSVTSGYTGGHIKNPSYKEVCTGTTGHAEAVKVVYDPSKTNSDVIQKKIIAVGHDTDKYKADDKVYAKLPGCCQYDRKK